MTMIEKMARAMWDASEAGKSTIKPWHDAEPADQDDFLDMARAALQAIREPDFDVHEAGAKEHREYGHASDIYRAMIDHILNEGEGK